MNSIKMLIPKGRMFEGIASLLFEAGYELSKDESGFRPVVKDEKLKIKIVKARDIGKLVEIGAYDVGITGKDWLEERGSRVIELLDLGLYSGKVIAAIPVNSELDSRLLNGNTLFVASEFENLSRTFMESLPVKYVLLNSCGATEAYPPEDADLIVDNTFTGKTLERNNLKIWRKILDTSARLVVNPYSLQNSGKKKKIDEITGKLANAIKLRNLELGE